MSLSEEPVRPVRRYCRGPGRPLRAARAPPRSGRERFGAGNRSLALRARNGTGGRNWSARSSRQLCRRRPPPINFGEAGRGEGRREARGGSLIRDARYALTP